MKFFQFDKKNKNTQNEFKDINLKTDLIRLKRNFRYLIYLSNKIFCILIFGFILFYFIFYRENVFNKIKSLKTSLNSWNILNKKSIYLILRNNKFTTSEIILYYIKKLNKEKISYQDLSNIKEKLLETRIFEDIDFYFIFFNNILILTLNEKDIIGKVLDNDHSSVEKLITSKNEVLYFRKNKIIDSLFKDNSRILSFKDNEDRRNKIDYSFYFNILNEFDLTRNLKLIIFKSNRVNLIFNNNLEVLLPFLNIEEALGNFKILERKYKLDKFRKIDLRIKDRIFLTFL